MKTLEPKATRQTAISVRRGRTPLPTADTPTALAQRTQIREILRGPEIQAKLVVGQPDDPLEREADRVADQVLCMPDAPACGALCTSNGKSAGSMAGEESQATLSRVSLDDEEEENPRKKIRRLPSGTEPDESPRNGPGSVPRVTAALEASLQAMRPAGRPLSQPDRAFFEPRFGRDFGNVRLHTDPVAHTAALDLRAQAFTHREHIFFGPGRYQPDTETGRRLLTHELAHVVQQSGVGPFRGTGADGGESGWPVADRPAIGKIPGIQRRDDGMPAAPPELENSPENTKAREFPPEFDPEREARKLQEAFKGWGTDERAVLDILCTGRQDMTKAIETAYNRLFQPTQLIEALREELSGNDLERALILLGGGKLSLLDHVREIVRDAIVRREVNTERLFHLLENASEAERASLNGDDKLKSALQSILPGDEWEFVKIYLQGGKAILAARLRAAVRGWGTDEKTIWRGLEQASPEEREYVLSQPMLLAAVEEDLSGEDKIRFERSLRGTFGNLDRLEIATLGWGTDEAALMAALRGLTEAEFAQIRSGANKSIGDLQGLRKLLNQELSGSDLMEALEILNQKQVAFDPEMRAKYLESHGVPVTGEPGQGPKGASVIVVTQPKEGEGEFQLSKVGRIKVAASADDPKTIWNLLNSLTGDEREFIVKTNPDGVLDALREGLSERNYLRAMEMLGSGAGSVKAAMKQALQEAIDGWGADKRLFYDAIDRALKEKVGEEILADSELNNKVKVLLPADQYRLFSVALRTGAFTPLMRLQWATTAMPGTDEELVFELCGTYGKDWYKGSQVDPSVDKSGAIQPDEVNTILKSELDTRDYWKALDRMRPNPETEAERLARSKEMLERERGEGVSNAIMDAFSYSGENADDAWREYKATYNRAFEDGTITDEERKLLRKDERYSAEMTEDYREAKASLAQWATNIAVAIVGVVATMLIGPAAGALLIHLAANAGKIAIAMVASAALKVGLNRAIQGEGYDVTSSQALVDAVSAGVEAGLTVVGGHLATRFMEGVGKTALARSVGPVVKKAFGEAGTRIWSAGVEGTFDATIGGIGEGLVQGLASEETWASGIEGFFRNMGKTVGLTTAMSAAGGFVGGAAFKSIGEVFGPGLRGKLPAETPTSIKERPAVLEKPKARPEETGISGERAKPSVEESAGIIQQPKALPEQPILGGDTPSAKDFAEWKGKTNPETTKLLEDNPLLARAYAELDPEVRAALTLCHSCCILDWLHRFPEVGNQIKDLLRKAKLSPNHPGLKKLFHAADSPEVLARTIRDIDNLADRLDPEELDDVLSLVESPQRLNEYVRHHDIMEEIDRLGAKKERVPKLREEYSKKVAQAEENRIYGWAMEEFGQPYLESQFDNLARQVKIRPNLPSGEPADFCFIPDFVGTKGVGGPTIAFEAKLNPDVKLTDPQKFGYPLLERYGGTVEWTRGPFSKGDVLKPTKCYRLDLQVGVNLKKASRIAPTDDFFRLTPINGPE